VGWHDDCEPDPTIASLSIGESRKFKIKHKISGKTTDFNIMSLNYGATLLCSFYPKEKTARSKI